MPDPKKPTPKNTDPDRISDTGGGKFSYPMKSVGDSWMASGVTRLAHQLLFGKGASIGQEGRTNIDDYIKAVSPDEYAFAYRPRSVDAGKDIDLPKSKLVKSLSKEKK